MVTMVSIKRLLEKTWTRIGSMIGSVKQEKIPLIVIVVLFFIVLIRNAWVCDDAYITYRTVDNFVGGFGLRWNIAERVQSYTHPLWMLIVSLFYFVTGEVYFTGIGLGLLFSMIAVIVLVFGVSRTTALAVVATVPLILSKAFVDFSTSGLENPLSHALLIVFFYVYFRREWNYHNVLLLTLIMSFGLLSRMDTLLLFAPSLVYVMTQLVKKDGLGAFSKKAWSKILIGITPFVVWELFSLFYYGSLFPNTAYAKLANGIPVMAMCGQGFGYYLNTLVLDPLTLFVVLLGIVIAAFRVDFKLIAVAVGVVLYCLYIVRVGGCFMGGRFFTAPLFCSVVILSRLEIRKETATAAVFLVVFIVAGFMASFPTLSKEYMTHHKSAKDSRYIEDTKRYYFSGTGLVNWGRGNQLPRHKWVNRGRKYREQKAKLKSGGGLGFTGFFAGPDVHILDKYALSDPLLARLPWQKPGNTVRWKPSHFSRYMPKGYKETIQSNQNKIENQNLAKYYDKLVIVTRDPLLSAERLATVIKMNLGFYDWMIDSYIDGDYEKRRNAPPPPSKKKK